MLYRNTCSPPLLHYMVQLIDEGDIDGFDDCILVSDPSKFPFNIF